MANPFLLLAAQAAASKAGGGGGGGGPGLGAFGGSKSDSSRAESGPIIDNSVVVFGSGPTQNLGEILRIANEGSRNNGGEGVILNPPTFSGVSANTSVDTPFGGFSIGGDVTPIALIGAGVLVLVLFLRRRA